MSDTFSYDEYLARALATPGGHLSIGRGGFSVHYDSGHLSGYDCETVEAAAIAAGLPVIDSRMVPFEIAAKLAINGPMIAINHPAPAMAQPGLCTARSGRLRLPKGRRRRVQHPRTP